MQVLTDPSDEEILCAARRHIDVLAASPGVAKVTSYAEYQCAVIEIWKPGKVANFRVLSRARDFRHTAAMIAESLGMTEEAPPTSMEEWQSLISDSLTATV